MSQPRYVVISHDRYQIISVIIAFQFEADESYLSE